MHKPDEIVDCRVVAESFEDRAGCADGIGVDFVRHIRASIVHLHPSPLPSHPPTLHPPKKLEELNALMLQVDAGADFGVTQLFYDPNLYFEFLRKSHAIGVPKSFDVLIAGFGPALGLVAAHFRSLRCLHLPRPTNFHQR